MIRLVAFEARKLFDTRSSVLTMATCITVAVGLAVLGLVIQSNDVLVLSSTAVATVLPFAVVSPILGAVAAASDWRTHAIQQTLFLRPRRESLFVAKAVAALTSALVVSGSAAALGVVVGAVAGPVRQQAIQLGDLGGVAWSLVAIVVPGTLFGFAVGALVMSPPVAIAIVLVVELALDVALSAMPGGAGVYFMSAAFPNWLTDGNDPLPALTSAALWILLPGCLGFFRYRLTEAA